jgi:hypothetical protein
MTTSSNPANAHGEQMAKYFTMNQPPHVAIDSLDSIVRPQLAITPANRAERYPGTNGIHPF